MDWTPYAVGGAAARPDSFTGLDQDFAARVYAMTQAAHAAGVPLQITSAYRSPEVQARLYAAALEKYGSPEKARKWVAPPGRSQHNHGTAVDFAVDGALLRDANHPAAQWIAANAAKYGLDVPMSWEPWQVELAGARDGTYTAPERPTQADNALYQAQPPEAQQNALLALPFNGLDPADFINPTNALATNGFDRASNPYLRLLS